MNPEPQVFSSEAGLVTDQPTAGRGQPGTLIDGRNVLIDENGQTRVFSGTEDQSEDVAPASALGYTVDVTLGGSLVTGNAGATFLADFSPYQHALIGRRLYVVLTVLADDQMTVTPEIEETDSAAVIAQVPNIHALGNDRGSLVGGSVTLWREDVLLAVGRGRLRINGDDTTATLDATSTPQVAYPDPANPGEFIVAPAGFSKPAAPTLVADSGSSGVKNMSAGQYSFRVARGRVGFPGIGPFSDPTIGTLIAGHTFLITLGAFAPLEGQNKWIIAATKSPYTGTHLESRGPWWMPADGTNEAEVESTTFEFEFADEELVDQIGFDDNFPPQALFAFTFNDRAYVASCYGAPDTNGDATVPGPDVAASKPNNIEAWSPRAAAGISPAEPIVGVHAGSLRVFALSTNHLNVGSLTGDQETPLAFRSGQPAGFYHQYQACLADEVLYYLTGDGLARTAGREGETGDFSFSSRVQSLINRFINQRSFVGYDPRNFQTVVFASNFQLGTGGKWQTAALSYNILRNTFNVLAMLGDGVTADYTVTGVATINSELWLVNSEGETRIWDKGDETIDGFLLWPFTDLGMRGVLKNACFLNLTGNANGAVTVHTDNDLAGAAAGTGGTTRPFTAGGAGVSEMQEIWKTGIHGKSFAVRAAFSLPSRDPVVDGADLEVEIITGRRQ